MFGKETDMTMTEFRKKYGYENIYPRLTEWILESEMTDEQKTENPEYKTTGGFILKRTMHEAWAIAWGKATDKEKKWFTDLPNFDAEIFKRITGIDVGIESMVGKKVSVMIDGKEYDAVIS